MAVSELAVLARIGHVEPAPEHRDRPARGVERATMRRAVDAARQSADDLTPAAASSRPSRRDTARPVGVARRDPTTATAGADGCASGRPSVQRTIGGSGMFRRRPDTPASRTVIDVDAERACASPERLARAGARPRTVPRRPRPRASVMRRAIAGKSEQRRRRRGSSVVEEPRRRGVCAQPKQRQRDERLERRRRLVS